jgi:DNA helicase II / ATP-dependent DNA helicase PcrA
VSRTAEEAVRQKISQLHGDDRSQLDVILSSDERMLVEAPAGYGKTRTMVSKIAYMISSGRIPYPKRLLALTFSVNAAYKMKKDIIAQVPELLASSGLDVDVRQKVVVSNYHGFSRSLLRKYGYVFSESLRDMDRLRTFDGDDQQESTRVVPGLTYAESMLLYDFNSAVKNCDTGFLRENLSQYNSLVVGKLLPRQLITYNGILTLAIKLFRDYPTVPGFYHKYLVGILIDEYQDTNALAYSLVVHLVSDAMRLVFLGDPLQRIYGFIGAVPNLMSISERKFNLRRMLLSKNHRFSSNAQMLNLDANIRRNAEQPAKPTIMRRAEVRLTICDDQQAEATYVCELAEDLVRQHPESKVAILFRGRGRNVSAVLDVFRERNTPYFFGLFTDESPDYLRFHRDCRTKFAGMMKDGARISRNVGRTHVETLKRLWDKEDPNLASALTTLLEVFWDRLFSDFAFLGNDEKADLVREIFEYNCLRQYAEFVSANITAATIHAAKGLEWDYVILPDMEQSQFPSYNGLCKDCKGITNCELVMDAQTEGPFLEELSVFYVGVTRARTEVLFSASRERLDSHGNSRPCQLSCFLRLPGINTAP